MPVVVRTVRLWPEEQLAAAAAPRTADAARGRVENFMFGGFFFSGV